MTIKIVLPEGDGIRASFGTKVYTDSGHEIQNISRIQMDLLPDNILEATITVAVSEIENLEGIEGVVIPEYCFEQKVIDAVKYLAGKWPETGVKGMIGTYVTEYGKSGFEVMSDASKAGPENFVCRRELFETAAKLMGYR